jgi:hypothetical protein
MGEFIVLTSSRTVWRFLSILVAPAILVMLAIAPTNVKAGTLSFGELANFGKTTTRLSSKGSKKKSKKKKYAKAGKSSSKSFSSYYRIDFWYAIFS